MSLYRYQIVQNEVIEGGIEFLKIPNCFPALVAFDPVIFVVSYDEYPFRGIIDGAGNHA